MEDNVAYIAQFKEMKKGGQRCILGRTSLQKKKRVGAKKILQTKASGRFKNGTYASFSYFGFCYLNF